jgi:hypothetical protein
MLIFALWTVRTYTGKGEAAMFKWLLWNRNSMADDRPLHCAVIYLPTLQSPELNPMEFQVLHAFHHDVLLLEQKIGILNNNKVHIIG